MFFTDFPYDNTSAEEKSTTIAKKLTDFSTNGIMPMVIVEPYVGDTEMQYKDFINGKYAVSYTHLDVYKRQSLHLLSL